MKKSSLKFVLAVFLIYFIVLPCFSRNNRNFYPIPKSLESEDYIFEGACLQLEYKEPVDVITLIPGKFYNKGMHSGNNITPNKEDSYSVIEKATGKRLTFNFRNIYKYELENIHDTNTGDGDGFEVCAAFFPGERYVDVVLGNISEIFLADCSAIYCHLIRFDFEKDSVEVLNSLAFENTYLKLFSNNNKDNAGYNLYKTLLTGQFSFVGITRKYNIYVKNNVLSMTDKGYYGSGYWPEKRLIDNCSYSTKSELKEGSTIYYASNLGKDSNDPWVCGLEDFKDEEITITSPDKKMCYLVVGNGFKRKGKEYLFKNNSRPKEIEIIYDNNYGMRHIVELDDTPELKSIPLLNCNSKSLKIKILSVYEGAKYSDVCINCLIPVIDAYKK